MELEIIKIKGQGKVGSEFVLLLVKESCNLQKFMIADNTFHESGALSNKTRHTYFFPPKQVEKDEWVVLITGPGKNHSKKNDEGLMMHYFHWGLATAVWNDTGDTVHLLKYNVVDTMKVPPKT